MTQHLNDNGAGRLHVAFSFPTRIGVPGIGTTAWYQVAGLVERGVRVTLYCGTCERPIPGLHRLVETMNYACVRIPYRLIGRDRAIRWHDRLVANDLRRRREPTDVVHCWPLGAEQTLRTARRLGIAGFLERPNAHTAYAYEVVARESQRLGMTMPANHTHAYNAKRLEREEREYQLADHLLCPSDFVARTFTERGHDPERLIRHQYGYDPTRFYPSEKQSPRSGLRFLYAGRCEPRKGLHFVLEAWKRANLGEDHQLFIAGEFVAGYREYLQPLLAQSNIRYVGFVDDMPALMRDSDVFVLSSIEEGSALVTYEARGSGNVLLVSDATGAICVDNEDALLHKAADVERLAEHMRALATDGELLERLRKASLAQAPGFTWAEAGRRLHAAYLSARAAANRPAEADPASDGAKRAAFDAN